MGRIVLPLTLAVWLFSAASCSHEQEMAAPHAPAQLSFTVASAQSRAGETDAALTSEERNIRSLWVYAFDDRYPTADYFADPNINSGQGVDDTYTVQMDIYDVGTKRFYVIANPPLYIREQLTPDCSEDRLKNLTLQLRQPIGSLDKLPQHVDGVSAPGNYGFPMSNVVTVQAALSGGTSRQMQLYVPDAEVSVTSIPVIRSLGKISVQAYLSDGNDTPVAVTDLKLYNYTGDGLFIPMWQDKLSDWTDQGVWNTGKRLDLAGHASFETKVQTTAVSVFSNSGTADESHPGYIGTEHNAKDQARTITSFYVNQNSYGERTTEDEQEGLPDAVGNRTTRLVVTLSDGRASEMRLPYLRRNDRLKVRIGISKYAIRFEFQLWQLSSVNPDWSEQ